jgi:colanic acid/amylovoran biosynthesis glycosyltransferase
VILVLFTASYPYGSTAEQAFLKEEVQQLASSFEKVILIPRSCEGERVPLSQNILVEEGYASFLRNPIKPYLIPELAASNILYDDLFTHPWLVFHPPSLFRLIKFLAGACLTRRWLTSWLNEQKWDVKNLIFYTYWFDQAAMGIGMAKSSHPNLKLVSRAHGYDLYEERYFPSYWPARRHALRLVDFLFFISNSGMEYLRDRYPEFSSRYRLARLGVSDPGFLAAPSADGTLRLISCSYISAVKRVELLLEGIAVAARRYPSRKIEWHHLGGGKDLHQLQSRADERFPPNATAFFSGHLKNKDVMVFYRNNPVDVFCNVSSSEGIPVSIMEAVSCGIPVVATDVGGNREIVTDKNGVLLPANPSPQEVADAIYSVYADPQGFAEKRTASRKLWFEQYNAEKNISAFIERIKAI